MFPPWFPLKCLGGTGRAQGRLPVRMRKVQLRDLLLHAPLESQGLASDLPPPILKACLFLLSTQSLLKHLKECCSRMQMFLLIRNSLLSRAGSR